MMRTPAVWSPERERLAQEMVTKLNPYAREDWGVIGDALGMSADAVRVHFMRRVKDGLATRPEKAIVPRHIFPKQIPPPEPVEEPTPVDPRLGTEEEPDKYVSTVSAKALSEAEMVELFRVDTLRWEVIRLKHTVWEVGQKGPDGFPLTTPLCQTSIQLRRIEGAEDLTKLTESLLQSLKVAAPSVGPFVIKSTTSEHLLELDAFDLHLGKVSWSPETGQDYDLGIASKDFREAVEDILHKASMFKLGRALFPIGNDLLHTDNLRSETTAGTRVDSDSRYHKMFETAVTEMRWGIDRLKTLAPIVEVKVLPGNHDRLGAYTVGRVLEAVYEHDPRVVIDNSPRLRKYAHWGKTLLGYTHGNEEKQKDLPIIMAQECPEWWAVTLFRLWRGGHLHTFKKTMYVAGDSLGGVEYRTIRSLSATDSWHAMKGFIGGRRAIEAFVHHIEEGEVGAFISRLPS